MSVIELVVPGQPLPKERPRRGRGGRRLYTPEQTRAHEETIRWQLRALNVQPLAGDVAVWLRFFVRTSRRIDMDNCEKLVLDACNKIAYEDDAQVIEKHTLLFRNADSPRTELRIVQVEKKEDEEDDED